MQIETEVQVSILVEEYKKLLLENYKSACEERCNRDYKLSWMEYLSEYLFEFITENEQLAEVFAHMAVEVCIALSEETTYDYIKDLENYKNYLLMCNMAFFKDKIDWGISIRGSFWCGKEEDDFDIKLVSKVLGVDVEGEFICKVFTLEEWKCFIRAIKEISESA